MARLHVEATTIDGIRLVTPARHGDDRGWLSETFNHRELEAAGIAFSFVQENHSFSADRGTIRGLHFQVAPHAQAKLVRVTAGAILDVAVDMRTGSETYGQHVAVRLDAQIGQQLLIPSGFAHGFCTLQDDTEVLYKISDYYAPDCERGISVADPALAIDWPVDLNQAILSDRDRQWPSLDEYQSGD
ncbi:MAG: dTDP-4-dehydrorhamnose 3,5-epimerase [Phycisphaeraceae bacterium]|nr:dTDP-4-dehydrorhamnose 3,5-epimerase [Phycisphaeraceae bacterium]